MKAEKAENAAGAVTAITAMNAAETAGQGQESSAAAGEPALEFASFSFAYPGRGRVLDSITFKVPRGSFTVVTGPSGAGKTTLCLAACGLVPHYFGGTVSGRVIVAGIDTMAAQPAELARQVGTVLEDYESQLVTMTAGEEVAFALENRGLPRREIAARTEEALALVGLADKIRCDTAALSGGQKQRLAIAAVLATAPEILVLDEPASALDPEGAEDLYALLGRFNREQGMTVIVIEHDLARALPYADQLVVLCSGRVAAAGPMAEVLSALADAYPDAIPALWKLQRAVAAETGMECSLWRSPAEAMAELAALFEGLRQKGRGVARIA